MKKLKSIGEQEMNLLQHIADAGDASVAEVVAGYGESAGLARSTVLTMMERLREKNYLSRVQKGGSYRYRTTTGPVEVMRGAVETFVQTRLQGSVSPFVAWMSERGEVSDDELAELEALVGKLQSRRRPGHE